MSISWKKLFVKLSDLIIFIYIIVVFFSYGNSSDGEMPCKGVDIEMGGEGHEGFLNKSLIEDMMKKNGIYPKSVKMKDVSTYRIENVIRQSPYVSKVNCYKTHTGKVKIDVEQRIPSFLAVSDDGSRYFMDELGKVMPENGNAPYVMVVTGSFDRQFAKNTLIPLVSYITADEFWNHQVQQINVLEGGGIELVPRVGSHMVYVGRLPSDQDASKNIERINKYMEKKLTRLFKFYKYGLNKVGWNKYSYINIEFDNQIICKKINKR